MGNPRGEAHRLKVGFLLLGLWLIMMIVWRVSPQGSEASSEWESVSIPSSLYGAETAETFAWIEDKLNVQVVGLIPDDIVVSEDKGPPQNIKAVLDSLARGMNGSWSRQGNTIIFSRPFRTTTAGMENRRFSWNKLALLLRSLPTELREPVERGEPVFLRALPPLSLQYLQEFFSPYFPGEKWNKIIQADSGERRITFVLNYDPIIRIDFKGEPEPVELHFGTTTAIPEFPSSEKP